MQSCAWRCSALGQSQRHAHGEAAARRLQLLARASIAQCFLFPRPRPLPLPLRHYRHARRQKLPRRVPAALLGCSLCRPLARSGGSGSHTNFVVPGARAAPLIPANQYCAPWTAWDMPRAHTDSQIQIHDPLPREYGCMLSSACICRVTAGPASLAGQNPRRPPRDRDPPNPAASPPAKPPQFFSSHACTTSLLRAHSTRAAEQCRRPRPLRRLPVYPASPRGASATARRAHRARQPARLPEWAGPTSLPPETGPNRMADPTPLTQLCSIWYVFVIHLPGRCSQPVRCAAAARRLPFAQHIQVANAESVIDNAS